MIGKTWKTCAIGAAMAGLTALTGRNTQAAVTYDTRALKGDQAPGTDPGVVYSGFGTPVLNGAGQTLFTASISGLGVGFQNDAGLWSEGSGALSLVARAGSAAPGPAPGGGFNNIRAPAVNDAGPVAFRCPPPGPGGPGTHSVPPRWGCWP